MAFSIAASAMASDVPISFWLAGEAVILGLLDGAPDLSVLHGPNVTEVLAGLMDGDMVSVCAPCLARRDISPSQLHSGLRVAGATAFVAELQGDVVALVY